MAVFNYSITSNLRPALLEWSAGLFLPNVFSNMRSAQRVGVGVVLICALCLAASYIATSRALTSPDVSIPTYAPARLIESNAPLPSETPLLAEPALASDLSPSPSEEGADPRILLERRCLAIAERDPLAAMKMAVANHLQDVDAGLPASLIAQWATQDFEHAYGWTKAQEPSPARDDMFARLAYLRARADPAAAARLVATAIPAGPVQDEAVISVIHQWALQDPRGAALWAESFPDEALRQRASDEIAGLAAPSFPLKRVR